MILKLVNYKKIDGENGVSEIVDYIDKIINASVKYDEESGFPVVKCTIENNTIISIDVPNIAYLMNDNGKTIDRIVFAGAEQEDDSVTSPELHGAIAEAVSKYTEE